MCGNASVRFAVRVFFSADTMSSAATMCTAVALVANRRTEDGRNRREVVNAHNVVAPGAGARCIRKLLVILATLVTIMQSVRDAATRRPTTKRYEIIIGNQHRRGKTRGPGGGRERRICRDRPSARRREICRECSSAGRGVARKVDFRPVAARSRDVSGPCAFFSALETTIVRF